VAEFSAKEIEEKILADFANVASSIGYSDLHGKLIAVLLVESEPISLQELSKKAGYSSSMISLSLDFLELLGVVKRIKKSGDRKLYIQFQGDLLESLKKAILLKLQKAIVDSSIEFEESRKALKKVGNGEKKKVLRTLNILEREIKRLERYVEALSKVELPKED